MKGQLFSLDIIAAAFAFIVILLGVYLFLTGLNIGEMAKKDQYNLFVTRLTEVMFSKDPYYGIFKDDFYIFNDSGTLLSKFTALQGSSDFKYRTTLNGKRYESRFEVRFNPAIDGRQDFFTGSCDNGIEKQTIHRYVMDENKKGYKVELTVCLVPI